MRGAEQFRVIVAGPYGCRFSRVQALLNFLKRIYNLLHPFRFACVCGFLAGLGVPIGTLWWPWHLIYIRKPTHKEEEEEDGGKNQLPADARVRCSHKILLLLLLWLPLLRFGVTSSSAAGLWWCGGWHRGWRTAITCLQSWMLLSLRTCRLTWIQSKNKFDFFLNFFTVMQHDSDIICPSLLICPFQVLYVPGFLFYWHTAFEHIIIKPFFFLFTLPPYLRFTRNKRLALDGLVIRAAENFKSLSAVIHFRRTLINPLQKNVYPVRQHTVRALCHHLKSWLLASISFLVACSASSSLAPHFFPWIC